MQKSRIHRWIQRTPGLAAELKRSIFRFLLADPRTPFVDELDAAAKYYDDWDEIPLEADESALSVPLVSIPFGLLA